MSKRRPKKVVKEVDAAQRLRKAMELSLELMKQGSYRVEMSDEGLMTEDIEECLGVVLRVLKKCDLPPGEVAAWCAGMSKSDRVGFICDKELAVRRGTGSRGTPRMPCGLASPIRVRRQCPVIPALALR